MNQDFLQELRQLLRAYAQSKRVVRLTQGPKQYLIRVHSVGQYMFHSELLDTRTKVQAGFLHMPILVAADLMCLNEDNQWLVVRNMYESDETRVTP